MLWECERTRKELRQLVGRTTKDVEARKDLFQEALVHLWKEEMERPGRTRSWYLQSCLGHIRNCMRHGRSLDSDKRAAQRVINEKESCSESEEMQVMSRAESCLGVIYTRDILSQLWPRLGNVDRAILLARFVGFPMWEIATELGLTQPAISSHCSSIARVARGLGIRP